MPSPGNDSAFPARSPSVSVQKVEYRVRYLAELNVASAQLVGDVHGHVTRPALGRVEGNNADWMAIVPVHEVADQRLAISAIGVGFAPGATDPVPEVVEDKVGVLVGPIGHD